jgi:hypothetical protein
MVKKISILIIPLLLIQLTPAFAAVKAGATCKTAGITSVVSTKTYTCIKSGKKLLWDKGAVISQDAQVAQVLPLTSFQQISTRSKDVSVLAFRASASSIRKAGLDNAAIHLWVGPNSKDPSPKDFDAVHTVQKIFYGSNLPSQIDLIYYSKEDSQWGSQQMTKLEPATEYLNVGGGPRTSVSGAALVDMGYSTNSDNNIYLISGAIEAHEFMHNVQQHQFIGAPYKYWTLPRWMVEGGGRFVENLVVSGLTESEYLKIAKNTELKGFNEKYFSDFLDATTNTTPGGSWINFSEYGDSVVYGVGAKIQEIMVALKGTNALISFMDSVAQSGNFLDSFEKSYGITWKDAKPLIAKYVYDSTR